LPQPGWWLAPVETEPHAGNPLPPLSLPLTLVTGGDGGVLINWQPGQQAEQEYSQDKLLTYKTLFRWRINAPGFMEESGYIAHTSLLRQLAAAELRGLDATPLFTPINQYVILHRAQEMFNSTLTDKAQRQWCRAFYARYSKIAQALGTDFNWPAFSWQNNALIFNLHFRDGGWGGAAEASLRRRAALNAYLPWCLLLAKNLDELPDEVEFIKLTFASKLPAGGEDIHAVAADLTMTAILPVAQLAVAAQLDNYDLLLAEHPLQIEP
jgi:hypothetical protein